MGKRTRLKQITKGWAGRTLASTRLAASLGKAAVKHAVGSDGSEQLGAELLTRMDAMKGLAMKVGQMASYLDGSLPPGAQEALRKLQRDSEPLPWEVVVEVLEAELGDTPEALFDTFEHEPVAAASIGQVHRAQFEGTPVAVKVQYPGIADSIGVDLGNLGRMGALAQVGMSTSVAESVRELHDRFTEECDYHAEAAFQTLALELFDDDERHVPSVIVERSTQRVLTTTWAEGIDFYAFLETADAPRRKQAAETLFETAFTGIFRHGMFNADPHPGNYLFGERITFLDWGCVCFFERDFIDTWKNLARVTLDGRRQDLEEAVVACGFSTEGDTRFDYDVHWEIMLYLYRPFLEPGFRYTPEYVRDSWELFMWKNPNLRHTQIPAGFTFVNRLQWGLNSVLAALDTDGDWGGLFREAVGGPTLPVQRPAISSLM